MTCIYKITSPTLKVYIGQTGIDEAGIVAANKLGYDCYINAPKSWRFITKNGREITDETMFKSRFI